MLEIYFCNVCVGAVVRTQLFLKDKSIFFIFLIVVLIIFTDLRQTEF